MKTTSLLVLVLFTAGGLAGQAAAVGEDPLSLAGTWRFALDRGDVGIAERWFVQTLPERIRLPGALQNQGFGDDITVDTKWTGDVGSDRWKQRPEYAPYRQPGNIKIPFFLQPEKHYVGAAWYQREIEIPKAWVGQRVVLTLERPHWGTQIWVDERLVGTNVSLATPHVYDLGTALAAGPHRLSIRVDNRILVEVGDWSHSVSDHTQGNWNGIVGRIELSATPPVWIDDLQVYPHVADKSVTVKGTIGNVTGQAGAGTMDLTFGLASMPVARRELSGRFGPNHRVTVSWTPAGGTFEARLPVDGVPDPQAWDEFNPEVYTLSAGLSTNELPVLGSRTVRFGLREISTRDRQFLINGRPTFFRGTLECCIFPKTGYPPTDVASWRRILTICRSYGLNHLRFHSWCPPEAAFEAGDELGFYYQVECGVWTNPGERKPIDQWIYDESERIVRAYGNHPSFVLLTHGNEPHGPNHQAYLAKWVDFWKSRDSRRLVTSGSAYPQLPENQYHVCYPCRGPHGWFGKDYRQDIQQYEVPVIVHEMGQWCAFPDFDGMSKYTGPLKPTSFEIYRDSLKAHGLWGQRRDFLRASGRLQVLCYKEEIEAALRTPGIGGVQLLDLHDFPGQGTALVGVLDPFWDSKGYVTPAEYRRFYNPTVPLARLRKNAWTTTETLTADVEIAHFGPSALPDARVTWKLVDAKGRAVAGGEFAPRTLEVGERSELGQVSVNLASVRAPAAYRLVVDLEADGAADPARSKKPSAPHFENDWAVWVYPAAQVAEPTEVRFTEKLDETALARLAEGGRVVLATDKISPGNPKLGLEPIFWNRYMFNTQERQTLGAWIDAQHPALAGFPTSFHQDWQWNDIVTHARAVVLDDLPRGLCPIVQPIDDWNTNRRLGMLFECRVGKGRLLICSADLSNDLPERPAARQLRTSLLAYAASAAFKPKAAVDAEQLRAALWRSSPSAMVNLGAKVVSADSEDGAHGNPAAKAIDGDPDTIWHTEWGAKEPPFPHELVVDLTREVKLRGFRLLPRQDQGNGWFTGYQLDVSPDGKNWSQPVAAGTWAADAAEKTVRLSSPVSARFVRLIAKDGVQGHPWAAVAEFDVIPADAR